MPARSYLPNRGISAPSAEDAMVAMKCALGIGHAANDVSQTIAAQLCCMRLGTSCFAAIRAPLFAHIPRPQGHRLGGLALCLDARYQWFAQVRSRGVSCAQIHNRGVVSM